MYKFFKRCFDFCSAALLFIVISPLFLLLVLLVRIKLGKPVFFCQVRSGKDRKPFKMIKFRTMTNEKDGAGNFLPDEQRLTKFGHWLRSTSLDELPELINIMKGDMSVIGPRPLQPKYDILSKKVVAAEAYVRWNHGSLQSESALSGIIGSGMGQNR